MSAPRAKRPRPGSRVTLQLTFEDDAASNAFKARLERVKTLLTPEGCPKLDNASLLARLFDLVEGQHQESEPLAITAPQHILPSAGRPLWTYLVVLIVKSQFYRF